MLVETYTTSVLPIMSQTVTQKGPKKCHQVERTLNITSHVYSCLRWEGLHVLRHVIRYVVTTFY